MYIREGLMHDARCNALVDLIFVRTVNIPNISLLPCLEVAKFFFDKLTDGQSHILRQHAA